MEKGHSNERREAWVRKLGAKKGPQAEKESQIEASRSRCESGTATGGLKKINARMEGGG